MKVENILPLTATQHGILYESQSNNCGVYVQQVCFTFKGNVNPKHFERALYKVTKKNEILRAVFKWKQLTNPVMIIKQDHKIPLKFLYDIDHTRLLSILKNEREQAENLSETPMRVLVLKKDNNYFKLFVTSHHIISDGWSSSVFLKELFTIYDSIMNNTEETPQIMEKTQYTEYLEALKIRDMKKIKKYWTSYTNDIKETSLNVIKKHSMIKGKNKKHIVVIENPLVDKINKFIKKNQVTLSVFFYSVWSILLKSYNDDLDQVTFGSVVSGRNFENYDFSKVMGLFINILPLKVNLKEKKFIDIVKEIQKDLLSRIEYENISLSETVEIMNNPKVPFDSIFAIENYPVDFSKKSFELKGYDAIESTNFDLAITYENIFENQLVFLYNTKNFEDNDIKNIGTFFIRICEKVLTTPEAKLVEMEFINEYEKSSLLSKTNSVKTNFPQKFTLDELMDYYAVNNPNKTAIIDKNKIVSYGNLKLETDKIAKSLIKKGVKREDKVAVFLDRSALAIIGIFAILKTGAAYVPIDINYPVERIKFVLEDSKAKIILTDASLCSKLPNDYIDLAINIEKIDEFDNKVKIIKNKDVNRLVYIIYTSGSTGKPKGVMIEHKSVLNFIFWFKQYFTIKEMDNFSQFSNLGFDGSVWEIFCSICLGITLTIVPNDIRLDLKRLNKFFEEKKVTISYLPTAVCEEFTKYCKSSLRLLFAAGDKLRKFHKVNCDFYNLYGPTETTVVVTCHKIDQGREYANIPIGKPIFNAKIYILDSNKNLVFPGVPGELYISGDCLGRGYQNNLNLTKENFIKNPFVNNCLMYKTGDIVRWNEFDEIEFLGRKDNQIKLRGFRIEIEEIELNLLKYSPIENCTVVLKTDKNGEKELVCYFTSKEDVLISEIQGYLFNKLPKYMIPSKFIKLQRMPLNHSGKVDKELLVNNKNEIENGFNKIIIQPKTDIEKQIFNIWKKSLNTNSISIDDNFFTIGGHSLKAMHMLNELEKAFGIEISFSDFMSNASIRLLSTYFEKRQKKEKNNDSSELCIEEIKKNNRFFDYPLTPTQKGIYLENESSELNLAYNIPSILYFDKKIDYTKTKQIINILVNRHEALRMYFTINRGEIRLKIAETIVPPIVYKKMENKADIKKYVNSFKSPFILNHAPLFRIHFLEIKNDKTLLLFDMHHIIIDGISINILIKEFSQLYNGEHLPTIKRTFSDYLLWREYNKNNDFFKNQKEYWKDILSNFSEVVSLKECFPIKKTKNYKGKKLKCTLNNNELEKIYKFCEKNGVTLFMFLNSIFTILLYKITYNRKVCIGTPVSGRRMSEFQDVVGLFINTLPIITQIDPDGQYYEHLENTKKIVIAAFDNQEFSIEEMVEEFGLKRDECGNVLFNVMLVLQNMDKEILNIKDTSARFYDLYYQTSKYELSYIVNETDGYLDFEIIYNSDLFDEEAILQMFKQYKFIIKQVVRDQNISINQIQILSKKEKRELIDFHSFKKEYPKNKTIIELFYEQVEKTPNNIAIIDSQKMTFMSLNIESNKLANYLINKGVKINDVVAVLLPRSVDYIIAILAILKVGGTYLPIDIDYPENRVQYMINDSATKYLICNNNNFLVDNIININDDVFLDVSHEEDITVRGSSEDLMYIIYTSGSTGKPKGVGIKNYSVVNHIYWGIEFICQNKNEVFPLITSMAFDLTVLSIFCPLLSGGTICIYNDKANKSALEIAFQKNEITVIKLTPTHLKIVEDLNLYCSSLKIIVAGGEEFERDLAYKIFKRYKGEIRIINEYGPTEATVGTTVYEYSIDERNKYPIMPIGKPIYNMKVYILDKKLNLVPKGRVGEIYIGGEGLSSGYINDEELTKKKFINNPFEENELIYKTGDLGKYLFDGNIQFIERIDNQVKINGYRIETKEIESILKSYPNVAEAVVKLFKEKNNSFLVAYVNGNCALEKNKIVEYLKKYLPIYMVPTHFEFLESFPITINGKIDLGKLNYSYNDILKNNKKIIEPSEDKNMKIICRIFENRLGIKDIGLEDNFFELGGDSIKAIQVVSDLNQYGITINLKDIFSQQTIGDVIDQAKYIVQNFDNSEVTGYAPLTPIQCRFFKNSFKNKNHFNQSVLLYTNKKINKTHFVKALNYVIKHHDGLRMKFHMNKEKIVQYCSKYCEDLFSLKEVDIPNNVNIIKFIEELVDLEHKKMDIQNGDIIKVSIFSNSKEEYISIIIHHLVIDMVSWKIFLEDLNQSYKQLTDGKEILLKNKSTSIIKWAKILNKYYDEKVLLKEIEYWKEVTSNANKIPEDYAINERLEINARKKRFFIEKDDTTLLLGLSFEKCKININVILLTIFAKTVNDTYGINSFLINLEGHGREEITDDIEISRTVGWFTTHYPFEIKYDSTISIEENFNINQKNISNVPKNGIGYNVIKYSEKCSSFDHVNPQVSFNYFGFLNENEDIFKLIDSNFGKCIADDYNHEYAIRLTSYIQSGQLFFDIEYDKNEYELSTIEKLAGNLNNTIIKIVQKSKENIKNYYSKENKEEIINEILEIE